MRKYGKKAINKTQEGTLKKVRNYTTLILVKKISVYEDFENLGGILQKITSLARRRYNC